MRCWPEVVNHFFRAYATPEIICNVVNNVQNIRQPSLEDGSTYSRRINDVIHRYRNVHDEIDKMILFVNELLLSVQTIVVHVRESKRRPRQLYKELVQYAQDGGKFHRVGIAILRVAKIVNTYPRDRIVHFLEPSTFNGRSVGDREQLYVTHNGLIPTEELPTTIDLPSSQPLLYIWNHTRRQQPTIINAKQLTAGDRKTATNRPR